jgi:DNA mismatch repair protein MutL
MSRIRVLPPKVVNLIAAGEIVDRPSSVVKELIENSLDAGAEHITVETRGDGRELIRVTDDGMGMAEEDAVVAFERHATSKVSRVEDLDGITTMGFRGEALPSIAAVSEMEVLTRAGAEDIATRVLMREGNLVSVDKAPRAVGTTISVSNLFFNTPARAKFLKTKPTELRHITRTFASLAMCQYDRAMKLIRNRRVILSLPRVESIEERVGGILGRGFAESSISVNLSSEYLQVCGFLSRPEEARSSSGSVNTFVNSRPVESRLIVRAICDAYGHTLKRNKYPTGVVLITVNPSEVDFNVHPTKKQVKFRREREVRGFIFKAVQAALSTRRVVPPLIGDRFREGAGAGPAPARPVPLLSKQKILVSEPETKYRVPRTREPESEVTPIVQIKNSYILAESDAEFFLIDQHAAHERVLYEEARARLEGEAPTAQKLLFPETIEVGAEEEEVIDEYLEDIVRMGFDVRKFGRRTYVVEAVPALLKEGIRRTILSNMVEEVIETRSESDDMKHVLAAAFACKAAIKAGDSLAEPEIRSLLDRLFASRMPFACPHGRPTTIRLSWEEIEKRFLRR